MQFTDEERDQLFKMTKLYKEVKELMTYAEELDDNKSTFLQPVNELRASFDHMMRVYAFKFGLKETTNSDYSIKNIDKSYGHVYRAGYDLLDYISIDLRKKIVDEISDYSPKMINNVFPKYYQEIRPEIENASNKVSKLRASKDVSDTNDEGFREYIKINKKLRLYYGEVILMKPSLIECQSAENKKKWINNIKWIVGPIIGALVVLFGQSFII